MKYIIDQVFSLTNTKLACFTLDCELDYGDRVGVSNIIADKKTEINELSKFFKKEDVPVSVFIMTELLERYRETFNLIKNLGVDFHTHSHSHNCGNYTSEYEICKSRDVFYNYFGYVPIGYRAPQGVITERELDILKQEGYKFSSSIFPSIRMSKFNNQNLPITPFKWKSF